MTLENLKEIYWAMDAHDRAWFCADIVNGQSRITRDGFSQLTEEEE